MRYVSLVVMALLVPTATCAPPAPVPAPVQAAKAKVVIESGAFAPGIPLPEGVNPCHGVRLDAEVDGRGEGKGTITFTTTPPNYDEYGDLVTGRETDTVNRARKGDKPAVTLECSIEFVSVGFVGRVNTPATRRSVYRLKGPKLATALTFVTEGPGLKSGRLLVPGPDGRPEYVVEMALIPPPNPNAQPVPCHPGCFPAGTPVRVPGGTAKIETLKVGDAVTTVGADGKPSSGKVTHLYETANKLVEVKTDGGTALTTAEQPLSLVAGGLRKAGDLKPGDRVWRWVGGERKAATVATVTATGRTATVYNLILGDSAVFVAGDFLARGKPPADAAP